MIDCLKRFGFKTVRTNEKHSFEVRTQVSTRTMLHTRMESPKSVLAMPAAEQLHIRKGPEYSAIEDRVDDPFVRCYLLQSQRPLEHLKHTLEYVKQIGQGVAGDVFLAYDRTTSRTYALKRLSLMHGDKAAANELIVHYLLSGCSQVVPMLGWKEHPKGYIDLILKYFPDRDLFYYIERFGAQVLQPPTSTAFLPNATARTIMRKICTAMRQVHGRNVAHFDLKPENILVDGNPEERGKNNVFICDFGYASCLPRGGVLQEGGVRGTAGYMSPECTTGENCGLPADIWSIGAIAHVLLTGHVPFHNEFYSVLQMYEDHDLPLALKGNKNSFQLNEQALHFLKMTMQYNPRDRLTIDELIDHPWFKSRNRRVADNDEYRPVLQLGTKRKSSDEEP